MQKRSKETDNITKQRHLCKEAKLLMHEHSKE